ncbi:MAG: hypothetical protein BMS9Abin29_2414 [Gemmatimonadota bacterium]|nr:MAG: hypothetical protein BMS9Abin29_2414 [Gemmatimonadota bacterium]
MTGSGGLKSCLARMALLVVLAGGGYAAWRWSPEVMPRVQAWLQGEPVTEKELASPELAQATLDRFQALRNGSGPGRIALGNVELVSVLRYSLAGLIPEQVSEASVTLADDALTLSGKVPLNALEGLGEIGSAVGFLPDTLLLELEGSLVPLDDRRTAVVIHKVIASHIPLPDRMIAGVLRSLGRQPDEGLPPDALLVPLPSGLESAYILRDSLVLVADR